MFLRKIVQHRQGQTYTYYALSETSRSPGGHVRQRTICYLGRLDNLRPPDWLRVAERLPDPSWLPRLMEVGYTPPHSPGGPVRTVVIDPDSISCTPASRARPACSSWPLLPVVTPRRFVLNTNPLAPRSGLGPDLPSPGACSTK